MANRAEPEPDERAHARIAVVMPAYRSAHKIAAVLAAIPALVAHVIVVDDASPDDLRSVLKGVDDARLEVLTHPVNRGVGAATKTGFLRALELGADVVVKLDSDGQMDPARIPELVEPILAGEADFTKGNRFFDVGWLAAMPITRRIGNLGLSFLVKLASGYWSIFDPCNGYLAVSGALVRALRSEELGGRYFFEISLLCEAYLARAVVRDVPIPPIYRDEMSSLSPAKSFFDFLPRLGGRILRRIGYAYFLRDFNLVSVFLTAGLPLVGFGTAWSGYHWYLSLTTRVAAQTGTIIIGALTLLVGFQLLLQAVVLDVQNEPGRGAR